MPQLQPGAAFGKYQIVGELGRGGMAVVYRAYQPTLVRYVALKVLVEHLVADTSFVRRFQNEARTAASLEHPNIVPIYEVGEAQGVPYIAMRLIEGESLATYVGRHGPLALSTATALLAQVADALDFAHSRGVVHRDVKPSNILVDAQGRAYLMDFGIARAGNHTRLTHTGVLVGTPAYMAPEQIQGKTVGPPVDRYALGTVAYELLVGRVPFEANSDVAVLHAHVYEASPPLRGLRRDVPAAAEAAVLRMLDKDPARRWATCRDFLAALGGQPGSSAVPGPPGRATPSVRSGSLPRLGLGASGIRTWIPALAAAATLPLIGGALVLGSALSRSPSVDEAVRIPGPIAAAGRATDVPVSASAAGEITPSAPIALPASPVPTGEPTPTQPPTPVPPVVATILIGHSGQGQPIEALRVGQGSVRLGIVGSLHGGKELGAYRFLGQLSELLATRPELVPSNLTTYIVPTINPDDIGRQTGFNARGVDLNRNFPPNWVSETCGRPGGRYGPTGCKRGGGGTNPFSEPESQAARNMVEGEGLAALLIVNSGLSVISSRDGGGGRGEPLARQLSRMLGMPYVPTFTDYPVTGQLVDWAEDVGVLGVEVNMPGTFSFERGLQIARAVMDYLAQ